MTTLADGVATASISGIGGFVGNVILAPLFDISPGMGTILGAFVAGFFGYLTTIHKAKLRLKEMEHEQQLLDKKIAAGLEIAEKVEEKPIN